MEDLDELVLKCRDVKAKDYIREAVGGYRAGAYRSAIVATWIAVCFDLIGKFRELALAGDKEAERHVHELEGINRSGDIQRALQFEKKIIDLAVKMEMISSIEITDLIRLQEDRNRCAHPSLNADGERYSPPAELARLHIHSAVSHLLMHEPAQGKFALERLYNQIKSQYFPKEDRDALHILSNGPLKRARPSLPRNLTVLLLKDLFGSDINYEYRMRIISSLMAVREMHHEVYTSAVKTHFSQQVARLEDAKLHIAVRLLPLIKDSWAYLDDIQKDRISRYVSNIPSKDVDELDCALCFDPLKDFALRRVKRMTLKEVENTFFFGLHHEIMSRLVDIFLSSESYEVANKAAREICSYRSDISAVNVKSIIEGAAGNSQVMGSFELSNLIGVLRASNLIDGEEFENMLASNGLSDFCQAFP